MAEQHNAIEAACKQSKQCYRCRMVKKRPGADGRFLDLAVELTLLADAASALLPVNPVSRLDAGVGANTL